METRNCPNCAAPYDVTLNKCPYCGTSYFDISCIDIDSFEPFYLKLKKGNNTFVSKVIIGDSCITFGDSYITFDTNGQLIKNKLMIEKNHVDIDLHFESVT